jgi:pyruvate/2-oxoglutarate dehydrogenase complex dihydrolipoamide acyltransferase (E2) component
LVWWLLMAWSGRKRAKHVGTFSISSLGGYGALNAHHPLVTSTSLAMGPIAPDGGCDLSMICDHRVLDGMLAAQALCRLEERLMEQVSSLLPESERTRNAA